MGDRTDRSQNWVHSQNAVADILTTKVVEYILGVNILTVYLRTMREVQMGIAGRFRDRRLVMNLTQRELAARSGVTWSSLKRFEREGLIALDSLLNLALALNCLDDFDKLAVESQLISAAQSLDALLTTPTLRRRFRASR